jgi:exodeoxyribonuclease V alpha subunit
MNPAAPIRGASLQASRHATWTREALERAVAKEWLDAADIRLVEILCAKTAPSGADPDALALVIAALCRTCAEGGLCLTFGEKELTGLLRELLSATGTPGLGAADETGEASETASVLVAHFLADAESGRLEAILGSPEAPRPLLRTRDNLYFHRHWFAEMTVAEALRARRNPPAGEAPPDTAVLRDVLRETLEKNPLRPRGPGAPPLELASRQKWALVAALRERVFVLSGGPGTGKTTWTASWLRALLRLPGVSPDRVRLCAPTGRAAQRLQESLRASFENAARETETGLPNPDAAAREIPVTTLHTLLGYHAQLDRFARGTGDPLDADWVLVDEASMVDVFLLAALMRALPAAARLILVGDADQLPPVDAGSVLGDLLPGDRLPRLGAASREAMAAIFPGDADALPTLPLAGACPESAISSVMLDVSHRAAGSVVPLAAAVLAGDPDKVLRTLGASIAPQDAAGAFVTDKPVARIAAKGVGPRENERLPVAITATLHAWSDALYKGRIESGWTFAAWLDAFRMVTRDEEAGIAGILWKFVLGARVLAPLRQGTLSTTNANRILRARLEPEWGKRGDTPGQGFHGAPILITRNDRSTGLSNGEIGLWLEAAGGAAVFFQRTDLPGGWLRLPVSQLPAHEPGFAVTVHKSQGSECDEVLLILPEAGNRLLARETLYTAVTRARKAVRVFGSEESIREAVERKLRRQGGLRQQLEQPE